jgi:hypothetical protein
MSVAQADARAWTAAFDEIKAKSYATFSRCYPAPFVSSRPGSA